MDGWMDQLMDGSMDGPTIWVCVITFSIVYGAKIFMWL